MESQADPRRPRPPASDDSTPGLPAIDGADHEAGLETAIELDVRDDEASALDDAAAGDLDPADAAEDEDSSRSAVDEDDTPPPLEADPSLAGGESERWTEGSDADESAPWQEPTTHEPSESSVDRGEEGFDDLEGAASDALPGLPVASTGDTADDDADELDVSEAGALDPSHESRAELALPFAEREVGWHGPARDAARAVATGDDAVVIAARTLFLLDPSRRGEGLHAFPVTTEGEPSSVLVAGGSLWIATDAGDVWMGPPGVTPTRTARPGTDDVSVGGLDLAAVGGVVVARTRGGALFRGGEPGWVGPIVAKNVRRIRAALGAQPEWLALVVGSASAPELLTSRDARTFERVKPPAGAVAAELAREGDVLALATADGALFVSRDAGASWARVPDGSDAERVWVMPDGVVLAATFHEATDHGRLLRVDLAGRVEILLDVADEIARRRLAGPGEQDGDGRIHALALGAGALWVATGVGVFSVEPR